MLKLKDLLLQDAREDILNKKIKNPATGRMIKVITALNYSSTDQVYKTASAMLDRFNKKDSEEYEKTPNVSKQKKVDDKIQQYSLIYYDEKESRGRKTLARQLMSGLKKTNLEKTEHSVKQIKNIFKMNNDQDVSALFGDGQILSATQEYYDQSNDDVRLSTQIVSQDALIHRVFNFSMKYVNMQYFMISPTAPKGTGTKIFTNQVAQFKKLGFQHLLVHAAGSKSDPIYNGYYTWARLGYQFQDSNYTNNMIKRAQDYSDDEQVKSVKSLSQMMSFPAGRQFWKEHGFPFSGVFNLADGSSSMRTLEQYNEGKKNVKA